MGTKINEATLRRDLKGTENLPIVDDGLDKGRTTINDIKNYVEDNIEGYAKIEDSGETSDVTT